MKVEAKTCVVVPTLGRQTDWLKLALDSIASQSRPILLRIVAPDESVSRLASNYGAEFVLQRDSGLSRAINLGFDDLPDSVRYLSWLGDDDVLAPRAVEHTEQALDRAQGAPFVFGRVRYIDATGRTKCVIRPGRWAVDYSKRGRNFVGQPGSLIRRDAFCAVNGVDPELRNSMDQDLFLRLNELARPLYIARELAAWRVHPGSISSTKGASDESKQVGTKFRNTGGPVVERALRLSFTVSDRILLSAHPRIPAPRMPVRDGHPYTVPAGQRAVSES